MSHVAGEGMHHEPLKMKVYTNGSRPVVTVIAKQLPTLSRRERRQLARDAAKQVKRG